jgi:L-2-hydroxyglutarate oxidase LhgO
MFCFIQIHAGMYYEPGSTMAHTCVKGNQMMYDFCEKHKLPAERCGKMIVAVNEAEHKIVEKLYHQGNANGVKGLEIYDSKKVLSVLAHVQC